MWWPLLIWWNLDGMLVLGERHSRDNNVNDPKTLVILNIIVGSARRHVQSLHSSCRVQKS